jgi:translation initiation factor 2 beta subunit (eIF-2beta)/eIF-5
MYAKNGSVDAPATEVVKRKAEKKNTQKMQGQVSPPYADGQIVALVGIYPHAFPVILDLNYRNPREGYAYVKEGGSTKIKMEIRQPHGKEAITTLSNFTALCDIAPHNPTDITDFFCAQLCATARVDEEGKLVLAGHIPAKLIRRTVRRYTKRYIACILCMSLNTELLPQNSPTMKKCRNCGMASALERDLDIYLSEYRARHEGDNSSSV